MATEKLRLQVRLKGHELGEWANLARRCGTTRQALGAEAVRRLAASLRGPTAPLRPLLDAAERTEAGAGEALFLGPDDAGDLAAIAARYDATPERIAVAAVRFMLEDARGGILPMLRPMPAAPTTADERYTTFSVENAAENNFNKAKGILDQLMAIGQSGLTAESRAALDALEAKETVQPVRRT